MLLELLHLSLFLCCSLLDLLLELYWVEWLWHRWHPDGLHTGGATGCLPSLGAWRPCWLLMDLLEPGKPLLDAQGTACADLSALSPLPFELAPLVCRELLSIALVERGLLLECWSSAKARSCRASMVAHLVLLLDSEDAALLKVGRSDSVVESAVDGTSAAHPFQESSLTL